MSSQLMYVKYFNLFPRFKFLPLRSLPPHSVSLHPFCLSPSYKSCRNPSPERREKQRERQKER
ncbi:hypothetical protein JZ751_017218 [Albula glossodonta]|uniref:Uncharacterized protein n=1 Tax=Albula glossodonta TaxID=121402 RepID=A0A8T2MQE2_9TELE|nr:hypothetical protein JZ751_017218 [Albula glossodonta]